LGKEKGFGGANRVGREGKGVVRFGPPGKKNRATSPRPGKTQGTACKKGGSLIRVGKG